MTAVLGPVQQLAFLLLALLTLREHRRRPHRATALAAGAVGSLAVVMLAGAALGTLSPGPLRLAVERGALLLLLAFPVLLLECLSCFEPPSRRTRASVGVLAGAAAAATLAVPQFPLPGQDRPWWFTLYTVLVLLEWTVPIVFAVTRLLLRSARLPRIARVRARLLAVGATAMLLPLLGIVATRTSRGSASAVAATLVAAGLMVLGATPPRWLVTVWRGPSISSVDRSLGALVAARDLAQAAASLLPAAIELTGADGARLLDAEGRVLAASGSWTGEPGLEVPLVGCRLQLWLSPYTPLIGQQDIALLTALGAVLEVARARIEAHEGELAARDELRRQAMHDRLTGLPGRELLQDHLEAALGRRAASRVPFSVLFVDLDRFKIINDALGHQAGDEVLCEVSRRLSAGVRPGDLVSRIGGDEFVVVLEGSVDASLVAERLAATLSAPVIAAGRELLLGASIGVRRVDGPADVDQVLRESDAAMYHAKRSGGGRALAFSDDMAGGRSTLLTADQELRGALVRDELVLLFQPLVQPADGSVAGAEALLCWQHPVRGLLPATEFLPSAAENGLDTELAGWALQEAVAQLSRWQTGGLRNGFTVSVGLSTRLLTDPGLTPRLRTLLQQHGVAPARLVLAITEDALLHDDPAATRMLSDLRGLGVTLSLDRFGAGYSSLSRLRELPVQQVRIDRSLLQGGPQQETTLGVLSALTSLSGTLRLELVAAGVDTVDQLSLVQRLQVGRVQGEVFAPPLAAGAWDDLLATPNPYLAAVAQTWDRAASPAQIPPARFVRGADERS